MSKAARMVALTLGLAAASTWLVEAGMDTTGQVVSSPSSQISVVGRVTRGAPYCGETLTESEQHLADGNRITRRAVTRVCRDSEGRMRTDYLAADRTVERIAISDPVTGVSHVLYPATRKGVRHVTVVVPAQVATGTVESAGAISISSTPARAATTAAVRTPTESINITTGAGAQTMRVQTDGTAAAAAKPVPSQASREDLGQQTIEGLTATGSRTTTVIPAGAIGNAEPLRVVSELWTSIELKVLLRTSYSDPRTGHTTFSLTKIVRAEPDRSLFEVPPDYTVEESPIRRNVGQR